MTRENDNVWLIDRTQNNFPDLCFSMYNFLAQRFGVIFWDVRQTAQKTRTCHPDAGEKPRHAGAGTPTNCQPGLLGSV